MDDKKLDTIISLLQEASRTLLKATKLMEFMTGEKMKESKDGQKRISDNK